MYTQNQAKHILSLMVSAETLTRFLEPQTTITKLL